MSHIEDNEKTHTEGGLMTKVDSSLSIDQDSAVMDYVSKFLEMSNTAKENDNAEKGMGFKESIRTFPRAVFWSIVLSLAIIMEGYDLNLLSSLYGFDAFNRKFGDFYPALGTYQIPAKWQTGIAMAYTCGQILGLFIAGIIADIVGYRKTMMTALAATAGLYFIQFFAPNRSVLLVSYVLLGINWGSYQTLTVTYASEVAPVNLRLYLTTYVNMCWVFGQLLSSGVLKGVSNLEGPHAWRIPYAIQWIWPVPLVIGVFFAPESPWFLVKRGRDAEAKHSLSRLLTEHPGMPNKEVLAQAMLVKIQLTVKEESTVASGSILSCFKGINLRRTRVAGFTWLFQNMTGSTLIGYSTYFYIQAGLSSSEAFTFSIIQYCLGLIGTSGSWFLSQKFGRFPIFFGGLCAQFVIMIIVGGLGCIKDSKGASWGIGSLLLVFCFVYDLAVGPICYCIVTEIPASTLRINTVMLARNMYNISGIFTSIITPYQLNPTAWNWGAKTAFFWAGFCGIAIVWAWFDLPETKGRTYAELDVLFHNGVKARDFKKTEVEVFDAGKMLEKIGQDGIKDFVHTKEDADVIEEKA